MRHKKNLNHLSRKSEHRKAMLANMASSLIMHKRINTTLAKAKALRGYVEPLITRSKMDTTHSRRVVFSYLQNKEAVTELFREVSVKVADRPGGYTRIIKLGPRAGDNAEMCLIEMVDFNLNLLGDQQAQKTKSSRRRRGTGKKKPEATAAVESPAVKPEAPVRTAPPKDTAAPEAEVKDTQSEKAAPEAEAKEVVQSEKAAPEAEAKEVAQAEKTAPEAEVKKAEEADKPQEPEKETDTEGKTHK